MQDSEVQDSAHSPPLEQRTVRMPRDLWDDLRRAAHVESVRRDVDVTRADLVREACSDRVEELLPDGRPPQS